MNKQHKVLFIYLFCLFSRPPSPQGIKEDRAKKAANVETLNLDDDDDDEPLAVSFYYKKARKYFSSRFLNSNYYFQIEF